MPLFSALSDLAARAYGLLSGSLAPISDLFARTTSGSLGTAVPGGQLWVAQTGVWYATSGSATTSTAASSYPLATIPYKANATIKLQSASNGTGIAFWWTSTGNWWAVVNNAYSQNNITSYTCTGGYPCTGYTCASYGPVCQGFSTVCTSYGYSSPYGDPNAHGSTTTLPRRKKRNRPEFPVLPQAGRVPPYYAPPPPFFPPYFPPPPLFPPCLLYTSPSPRD